MEFSQKLKSSKSLPTKNYKSGQKVLLNHLILKTNFPVKIRGIHKIEKKIILKLAFLAMKLNKKIQFMCQKNVMKIMLIYD